MQAVRDPSFLGAQHSDSVYFLNWFSGACSENHPPQHPHLLCVVVATVPIVCGSSHELCMYLVGSL